MSEQAEATSPAPTVARHLVVHGRVQGVFFRGTTRQIADERGVAGWVANRSDGTVEAWLEGEPAAVAAIEGWITDGGPPLARVTHVAAEDAEPRGYRSFEVTGG